LLTRISKQVDMRFEMDGPNLSVMPDSPFLKHYKVDYVNMSRNVTGTVSTNTQIATGTFPRAASGAAAPPAAAAAATFPTRGSRTPQKTVLGVAGKNIKDILRETDKIFPEGSSETVVEQSNAQTSTGAAALPQGTGAACGSGVANALQGNPTPGSSSQAVAIRWFAATPSVKPPRSSSTRKAASLPYVQRSASMKRFRSSLIA
jgi:hypothetical protein